MYFHVVQHFYVFDTFQRVKDHCFADLKEALIFLRELSIHEKLTLNEIFRDWAWWGEPDEFLLEQEKNLEEEAPLEEGTLAVTLLKSPVNLSMGKDYFCSEGVLHDWGNGYFDASDDVCTLVDLYCKQNAEVLSESTVWVGIRFNRYWQDGLTSIMDDVLKNRERFIFEGISSEWFEQEFVNREAEAMDNKIIVKHNFDSSKFMWLYAKYAYGANPKKHCTNAILGKYSTRFSRHNPDFITVDEIVLDEFPELNWDAIYICGVAKKGYSVHKNYPHNVHVAIIPAPGEKDVYEFENWKMSVENGKFEYVISEDELDDKYIGLPEQYVTCRMFRWAVWHYRDQLN